MGDNIIAIENNTDVFNLKACLEELKSEIKSNRKKSLENIIKQLYQIKKDDHEELISFFSSVNTHILRSFSDKSEVCREISIEIISYFVDHLPLNDYYLTYIIPIIVIRIGQPETLESSEELRLKLVILTQHIIRKYTDTILLVPFYNDFSKILIKSCADSFSKVKMESCQAIILLSNAIKRDFHMQSESFIKPVLSIFSHQHFRSRIAAVQTIGAVVMYGNTKCFEDSVTPMAEKLFDELPPVRLQVIKEVGQWMLHYRDRYSFWHRMIPLLLTGLSDAQPDIRKETAELWDVIGKQYMNENEEELKPQMDFSREEPAHYPAVTRPNLGCRTLVERNIGKIIPAITRELEGWKVDTRLRSSQLMYWLVLCAEHSILQHAATATKCFLLGAKDDETLVNNEIFRAAELLGYFVSPEVWWELLRSEINTWPCLGILSNIIKGTEPDKLNTTYLKKIARKLSKPEFCRTRKPKYQLHLLNTCDSLIKICTEGCQRVGQEVFNIIFTVYAMPAEPELEVQALCLLENLRSVVDCGPNLSDLFCKYISHLLGNITSDANLWTLETPERCILDAILIHTGSALGLNLHLLSPLLVEALSSKDINPEVKLKLFTNLSAVVINRDENFQLSSVEHLRAFLNIILKDAITPNLIWTAGRTTESIRSAAVCCLCAVLRDGYVNNHETNDNDVETKKPVELFPNKESFEQQMEELFPHLIGLIDAQSRVTRLYALIAICSLTKLAHSKKCFTYEHLHQIYPVVMKHLDDSNDPVRLASVQTLCVLFVSRPEPYDIVTFNSHLDAVYSAMLIHLDDPTEHFQSETLAALKELSQIHPKLLKMKVAAKMNCFRNKVALESLDKHLESLSL